MLGMDHDWAHIDTPLGNSEKEMTYGCYVLLARRTCI